jgi:FKBP-type peptidyl-prolyl cis-trans isomerase SlyD
VEETKEGQPFKFISGFGIALDAFENNIIPKAIDEEFSFVLEKEQAYGEHHDELVLDMEREAFFIDGRFDHEHIYVDAIVPLQNEEGRRFYGHIVEVGEEKVKVDLNHPLAGEDLTFKGTIVENREATAKEIEHFVAHMSGGCGCGCHDCDGNCDSDCHHEHHHEEGCGCGHSH